MISRAALIEGMRRVPDVYFPDYDALADLVWPVIEAAEAYRDDERRGLIRAQEGERGTDFTRQRLDDALAALRARLQNWRDSCAQCVASEARERGLREALYRYGVHVAPCRYGGTTARVGPQHECSCGLALLATPAAGLGGAVNNWENGCPQIGVGGMHSGVPCRWCGESPTNGEGPRLQEPKP